MKQTNEPCNNLKLRLEAGVVLEWQKLSENHNSFCHGHANTQIVMAMPLFLPKEALYNLPKIAGY